MEPIERALDFLGQTITSDGGFSARPGDIARGDTTGWAILALSSALPGDSRIESASSYLKRLQMSDGSVPVAAEALASHWPTSLALLAWRVAGDTGPHCSKALSYLLKSYGQTFTSLSDEITGHNTALKGWSWENTAHSWTEPTAYALMALAAYGESKNPRVAEGVDLLLNRQLPSGGWNYGSKSTYGVEHTSMADFTGVALTAIAGLARETDVERSIRYLEGEVPTLRTPRSLCWALFGLSAWDSNFPKSVLLERIGESISLQERFGVYDTGIVSLIIIALSKNRGLLEIIENM